MILQNIYIVDNLLTHLVLYTNLHTPRARVHTSFAFVTPGPGLVVPRAKVIVT